MGVKNYKISIILIVIFASISLFPNYTRADVNSSFLYLNYNINQEPSVNVLAIGQPDNDMNELIDQISSNYLDYGGIKINIDSTTATSDTITLSLLESTQADVLYLANLFGGDNLLLEEELIAISNYIEQGHSLVGSHGTLEPYTHAILAPYFGINSEMIASTNGNMPITGYSQLFDLSLNDHPIFNNVNKEYQTISPATLAPILNGVEDVWTENSEIILDYGEIIATSTDQKAAVIISESVNFRSVYLTHYPSQDPLADDNQLLYNSFIWSDWLTPEGISSESSPLNPESYLDPGSGFVTTNHTTDSTTPTPKLELNYDGYFSIVGFISMVFIIQMRRFIRNQIK
ncbi:MAG: hypothetical protein GPJ54_18840 [Candidatus Heimdallarchaeota archaeon]|nr:hypothetical protein [Candidatus Heimdallarchaeota archaeon]